MTEVAVFLVALFAITWGLVPLWPAAPPENLLAFLAPLLASVWTPTVLALVIVASAEGAKGLRRELRVRLSFTARSDQWLIVAAAAPILVTSVSVTIARAAGDGAPFIGRDGIPVMIGLQIVTGAVGEELGWRGFLLPRLGARVGAAGAGAVMAAVWALWHVPAYFEPGMPHETMPMFASLVSIGFFGCFLAVLFNRTGESIFATILAHLSLNVMLGLGGVQLSSATFWRSMAVGCAVLAIGSARWPARSFDSQQAR